ncbi:MAG: O-methyltransferase, partial [Bacilli bacterium]|nr:O-methyltransferase [Bacilli bacterium]
MKTRKEENYLNKLNKNDLGNMVISLIYDEAIKNEVPIIQDDGLDFLIMLVRLIKPKKILEIGTAVGFSSIMMAKNSSAYIDTIERNQEMYDKAISNIHKLNLDERIHVHFKDALEFDINNLDKDYDIIFIDAAKAQNQKFFLKYSPLLSDNGIIITDNILFHGYVAEYNETGDLKEGSKDLKSMVKKIDLYNKWLKNLYGFETKFINIGDGMAITMKKDQEKGKIQKRAKVVASRIGEILVDGKTSKYPVVFMESAFATEDERRQYHLDSNDNQILFDVMKSDLD